MIFKSIKVNMLATTKRNALIIGLTILRDNLKIWKP